MNALYLCGAGNSEGVRLALRINEHRAQWDHIVLLDDDPAKQGESKLGVEVAGPFEMLAQAGPGVSEVANLVARTTSKRWAARGAIQGFGVPFAPLISPCVDTGGTELAKDTIVYHNATVGPEVSVADGSVIFMGAVIGHECRVGRCCVVAANAVLNARVQLGEGVYVGTNATVLPEVTVGSWATIGAGSVVVQDVPAGATVMGVPAEILMNPSEGPDGGEFPASDPSLPFNQWSESGSSSVLLSDLEETIAAIWCRLLDRPSVGLDDSFFDAGGHSLLAVHLLSDLRQKLGTTLHMTDVFRFPTIRSMARHLHSLETGGPPVAAGHNHGVARRAALTQRHR
jgi:sugar O-acyltransferase (sialic acid O-acetyltransferase NeuD family)